MKLINKISFLTIMLVLLASRSLGQESVGVKFIEKPFDQIKEMAKAQNKLIFVDCYFTNCGPCKKMLKEEFPKKEMGDFLNANFISTKYNSDIKEEAKWIDLWRVHSFPTFIFMNADGEVLYRMTGFQPADKFISLVTAGLKTDDFHAIETEYKKGNRSKKLLLTYIDKLEKQNNIETSKVVALELLSSKDISILTDSAMFNLFLKYVDNPEDLVFLNAYKNKDAYISRYGSVAENKFNSTWENHYGSFMRIIGKDSITYDKQHLQQYVNLMKKYNVPYDMELCGFQLTMALYQKDFSQSFKLLKQYLSYPKCDDNTILCACTTLSNYSNIDTGPLKKLVAIIEHRILITKDKIKSATTLHKIANSRRPFYSDQQLVVLYEKLLIELNNKIDK